MYIPALGKPQTQGISKGHIGILLDLGATGYLFAGGRDKTDPERPWGVGVTGPPAQAWVPGTYALWGRGAWEAWRLHEVPLGLALQDGGARQRDVRLRREQ